MQSSPIADTTSAPPLAIPEVLTSEAAAILLSGDAAALRAIQAKMAAALSGQGLSGDAAGTLAQGWMRDFTNGLGAQAAPEIAIAQANGAAARMAQAMQEAAAPTGEQPAAAPQGLGTGTPATGLTKALFDGVMDPLARPAGAPDPVAALSQSLKAPAPPAVAPMAPPLSPADQLAAALASGVGVQDAVKALGAGQNAQFADTLVQALSGGAQSTDAVAAAREQGAKGDAVAHSIAVELSDGDRLASALASGGTGTTREAAGGQAFSKVLGEALAQGTSPDAALGASSRAQADMTANHNAATVPTKPADALVASLASGRAVAETVKSFATVAGLDANALGGYGQALGSALSSGNDPASALGTARQDVVSATALSAETTKGVKSDPLVAALASGRNVEQAVQSLGGSGSAFGAALGRALAEGRPAGQALATARQAADTVQKNNHASEVPVSAQDKALADLANPDKAAAPKDTGTTARETAQETAQHSESADGKGAAQVADAQSGKDGKGDAEKPDAKEGTKEDGKQETGDKAPADASATDASAADASSNATPAATDGSSPPPAARQAAAPPAMSGNGFKAAGFEQAGGAEKSQTGDASSHDSPSAQSRTTGPTSPVTKSVSVDAFTVATQSQQKAVQVATRIVETAVSDTRTPTRPVETPIVPVSPTVPPEHHVAAPTLSASFDSAAFAKAMAMLEGTAAPAGFTVFHLIEAMFRPGEAESSIVGVAVVANQGAPLGVWQYSADGAAWLDVGTVGETAALVLPGNALLRFLPATGASGQAPALELRAVGEEWAGGFSGGDRQLFALSGTGGTTPLSAEVGQLSVDITPVNGAPVATALTATLDTVDEDSTDPAGATVSSLFGTLFSDPTDAVFGAAGNRFAGVALIATSADAAKGEWEYWTGSAWVAVGTISESNALLLTADAKLRFRPSDDWNGTTPTLTVRLVDDSRGSIVSGSHVDLTSGGIGGTTPYSASEIVLESRVTSANDAPVATGTTVTLPSILEDATNPAAATVSSLFGGLFSDPTDAVSGGSSANSLAGVLVIGNAAATDQGMWQYWNGSAWTDIGTASGSNGVLLAAETRLRFLPAADWNGTMPALTVRLVDDSQGGIGSGTRVTATAGGNDSRYSADTISLTGTVGAVNDAPVATDTTATLPAIAEDSNSPAGATVSSLFGTLFSDAADSVTGGSDATEFAGIAIVGNAATASQGVWQYWTGTAWAAVGSASEGSALVVAATDKLRFVPAADWNGTTPALTVRLIEDGGTSSIVTGDRIDLTAGVGGNTVYSADTLELSGTVTPVNDAPQVTAGTATLTTLKGVAVAVTGLSISDIDAGTTLLLVTLTAGHGTLTLDAGGSDAVITGNGTDSVTVRATLATINSLLSATDGLLYTATSYTGADTIQVQVDDQGGGGSGGALNASTSVAVTVVPPNASPVLADTNLELSVAAEALAAPVAGTSGIAVSKLVAFGGSGPANVTDTDSGAVTGIALVGTNETYGHWWYSIDGGATWSLVGTVNDSDSALLLRSSDRLYFQPGASVPAAVSEALTFRAWDRTTGTYGTKGEVDTGSGSAFSTATDSLTLHPGVLVSNGSFDNGLTGWSSTGGTSVGSTGDGHEGTITSASGQTPTQLEDFLGLTHGSIASATGTTPSLGHAMKLASTVTVTQDTTLTFNWTFTFTDNASYHDFGFVSVNGVVTLLAKEASASGTFSVVVPANTTLSLGFGTSDTGDNSVNPTLRVDDIKLINVASDPIVLDMTGEGLALRPLSDGIHFDVTGDGIADRTGWIGPGNALLVRDGNGNGLIDDARELVSERFGSGFNSSLDALASLDRNHDGRLDAADDGFAMLKVWQDADSDGVSQPGELRGLSEAGIRSIATAATASDASLAGNKILGTTSMTMADGSSHVVAGVAFDVKADTAPQVHVLPQTVPSGNSTAGPSGGTDFTALLSSGLGLTGGGEVVDVQIFSNTGQFGAESHSDDQHHPQYNDISNAHNIINA